MSNVANTPQKKSLELTVSFTRRSFYDETTHRDINFLEATAVYCDETFRFRLNDKDSRLFNYLLKTNGFPVVNGDEE